MKETRDHFKEIVTSLFQEAENITVQPNSDLIVLMSWNLNNDKTREHKRSKTLKIIIPEEQIDDYENLNPRQRTQFDQKLIAILSSRKSQYDPNHENPHGALPPTEEWPIVV